MGLGEKKNGRNYHRKFLRIKEITLKVKKGKEESEGEKGKKKKGEERGERKGEGHICMI
jgi:hypothetical protein